MTEAKYIEPEAYNALVALMDQRRDIVAKMNRLTRRKNPSMASYKKLRLENQRLSQAIDAIVNA